jgi:hypothetical protein
MKLIATLPYDDIDFVWISNHYDVHISGLCKMGNTLFWFETKNHQEYFYDEEQLVCDVYMLSFWEEAKLRMRKFFFEQMVGFHWSYPKRKNNHFHYRKPEWLYKLLFKLYYTIKKF